MSPLACYGIVVVEFDRFQQQKEHQKDAKFDAKNTIICFDTD